MNKVGACTTQSVCDNLLAAEVDVADGIVKDLYESKKPVSCPAARAVLVDMSYNLGKTRLSKFKKLQAAVERSDWTDAAAQVEDSAYCRQVKSRCTRNMN